MNSIRNKTKYSLAALLLLLSAFLSACSLLPADGKEEPSAEETAYAYYASLGETDSVHLPLHTTDQNICVTESDIILPGYSVEDIKGATLLIDDTDARPLETGNIYDRIYPASTTKILTAYIVLNQCDLSEEVVVSEVINDLEPGSSVAGLMVGDRLTVLDLLYAMMLPSGNDAAMVLAEHVSGSIPAFVDLMNETAQSLFATGSHFANPHGLHQEDHYTTAYDLYLIFHACIQNETFTTILDTPSYTGSVTRADGSTTMIRWDATNYYFAGLADPPENVTVMGAKTGTTDQAGSCLVLLARDQQGKAYISIVMNAVSKEALYREMTELLTAIPAS